MNYIECWRSRIEGENRPLLWAVDHERKIGIKGVDWNCEELNQNNDQCTKAFQVPENSLSSSHRSILEIVRIIIQSNHLSYGLESFC